jgi:hypothetical protein
MDISMMNSELINVGGKDLRLDARPEPIVLNTARTALIVVDMQNDFGSKGGMFDRAGIDILGIQKVVGPTGTAIASARREQTVTMMRLKGFEEWAQQSGFCEIYCHWSSNV